MKKLKMLTENLFTPNINKLSEPDRIIFHKLVASSVIQNTLYYNKEENEYTLDRMDIFKALLTEEEAKTGLAFILSEFCYDGWSNDIIYLFEELHQDELPEEPQELVELSYKKHKDPRYKAFKEEREAKFVEILQPYIDYWVNTREKETLSKEDYLRRLITN